MRTVEDLQERHRQELAELQREHEIAASLPVPPDRVQINPRLAPWVTYKVQTILDAREVFRAFADHGLVRNMEHATGTFGHLCPASERGRDQVEHRGDYCAALDVRQGEGFGPDVKLFFYAETATGLCKISADLGGRLSQFGAQMEVEKYKGVTGRGRDSQRIVRRTFHRNDILNGLADACISYASGDVGPIRTSAHFVYVWTADDGPECTDFAHFLEHLGYVAEQLKA